MDEQQIQRAMERILTDESVTEELEDAEADLLLQWGEQQVTRLAGQMSDEQAFDEATTQLRKMMREINNLVGLSEDMDADEKREALIEIMTGAQALGYAITEQMADDFLLQPAAEDKSEYLRNLTQWAACESADDQATKTNDSDNPPDNPVKNFWDIF